MYGADKVVTSGRPPSIGDAAIAVVPTLLPPTPSMLSTIVAAFSLRRFAIRRRCGTLSRVSMAYWNRESATSAVAPRGAARVLPAALAASVVALSCLGAASAHAAATVAVGSKVVVPQVKRAGVNLGGVDYWDNVLPANRLGNPGLEHGIQARMIRINNVLGNGGFCGEGFGNAAGYWNGTGGLVRWATNRSLISQTFTVTTYTPRGTTTACPSGFDEWHLSPALALQQDDYIALRREQSLALGSNGCATAVDDARPGSPGKSAAEITGSCVVNGNGDTGDVSGNMKPARSVVVGGRCVRKSDPTSLDSWLTLCSTASDCPDSANMECRKKWRYSFWYKWVSGPQPTIRATVTRSGKNYVDQTVVPAQQNQWAQATFDFDGTETSAANSQAGITLFTGVQITQNTSAHVRVDDTYFGVSPAENPYGQWNPVAASALKRLAPGYIRDAQDGVAFNGNDVGNITQADQMGAKNVGCGTDMSLTWIPWSMYFDLARKIGSIPHFNISEMLTDAEYTQLGDWLLANASDFMGPCDTSTHTCSTNGALTCAEDRDCRFIIEYGNENWNPGFGGCNINYHPSACQGAYSRAFQNIRAHFPANRNFIGMIGVHTAWPEGPLGGLNLVNQCVGGTGAAPRGCASDADCNGGTCTGANPDIDVVAPTFYFAGAVSNSSFASNVGILWPPYENVNDDGKLNTYPTKINGNKIFGFYEGNTNGNDGDAPDFGLRDQVAVGAAAGAAVARRMIYGLVGVAKPFKIISTTNFAQIALGGTHQVHNFGIMRDLGVPQARPQGLAIQMLNRALGGDGYARTISGADAASVEAGAFLSNGTWAAAVVNMKGSAVSATVDFSGGPSGSLPTRLLTLTASAPSDNNDGAMAPKVTIAETAAPAPNGRAFTVNVPAYGLVVLAPPQSGVTTGPTPPQPPTLIDVSPVG